MNILVLDFDFVKLVENFTMNIENRLIQDLKKRRVILFVGAGVSMNLGLPSWSDLMDQKAHELGYSPEDFKNLGSFFELAEYYRIKKGSIGSLRSWMDTNFHSNKIKIEKSSIHRLITQLNIDKIYTTNYDRWIEKTYDHYKIPYDKITRIQDFARTTEGNTQIIKYHGDFDDDSSIILTETSYFERLELNTPLDMKLKSDSLGKSLLFIGYSLRDLHIRFLLYKLQLLWKGSSSDTYQQPPSYILLSEDNPVQRKVLESRNIKTIISNTTDPGKGLEIFLQELSDRVRE